PVALPARLRRGMPVRSGQRENHGALAVLTRPIARSSGLRANDRLPTPGFFPRVRLSAGPRAPRPLRSFPKPRSPDRCNRPARETTSKLRPEASILNEFARHDHFGAADLA